MSKRVWVLGGVVAWAVLLHGCGPGGRTVWVTGKLVKGGVKYDPPKDQSIQMTFVAIEDLGADGKPATNAGPYPVNYMPDSGTFTVPGEDGRGIPPGKYRVAVTQTMSSDAIAKLKDKRNPINRDTDLLTDKFSASDSPIVREIKDSSELTIDLDKPTG